MAVSARLTKTTLNILVRRWWDIVGLIEPGTKLNWLVGPLATKVKVSESSSVRTDDATYYDRPSHK